MKTKRLRINERAIGWAKKSVNAFFGNWNWRVDRGRSFFGVERNGEESSGKRESESDAGLGVKSECKI